MGKSYMVRHAIRAAEGGDNEAAIAVLHHYRQQAAEGRVNDDLQNYISKTMGVFLSALPPVDDRMKLAGDRNFPTRKARLFASSFHIIGERGRSGRDVCLDYEIANFIHVRKEAGVSMEKITEEYQVSPFNKERPLGLKSLEAIYGEYEVVDDPLPAPRTP